MNSKSHDVLVTKEFETVQNGAPVKRKVWNKIGRAWYSRSFESLNFELYLFPNQIYVIPLKDRQNNQPEIKLEDAPF